jgi:hypothetical protein
MNTKHAIANSIESKIYLIRGQKVMLDLDLAELYQVPTSQLNQQVKRNTYRFPSDFMFVLKNQEVMHLKSQYVISSVSWGGRRNTPLAFTEQGIAMLSSVLKSQRAIEVNIAIMRTFVQLKLVFISNKEIEKRKNELESKYDGQFRAVFNAIRELVSVNNVPRKRIIGLGKPES